jgi:hypothetical protein
MGPAVEIQTFETENILGKRRYFFRGVDRRNWETLFPSQTYKTKKQRDETATRLAYLMGCAVIPGKAR